MAEVYFLKNLPDDWQALLPNGAFVHYNDQMESE